MGGYVDIVFILAELGGTVTVTDEEGRALHFGNVQNRGPHVELRYGAQHYELQQKEQEVTARAVIDGQEGVARRVARARR